MSQFINDSKGNPITFIVIDDDETDREFIVRGLKKSDVGNSVIEFKDGLEALPVIEKELSDSGKTFLILLDLNMPQMNGVEFLNRLKGHKVHDNAMIFAFTTSSETQDVIKTNELGVRGFFNKFDVSNDIEDFLNSLKRHAAVL